MRELERLIEAARLGVAEDVRAMAHSHPHLVHARDETGATALHYAAFGGHRDVVRMLVEAGADINAADGQFGATPAGWAIEYLREMGGLLGIELGDFAYAIEKGDVEWAARFLKRFPALRGAKDTQGRAFKTLAEKSENAEILRLFEEPPR
jgi:ankyrin repeat protein